MHCVKPIFEVIFRRELRKEIFKIDNSMIKIKIDKIYKKEKIKVDLLSNLLISKKFLMIKNKIRMELKFSLSN